MRKMWFIQEKATGDESGGRERATRAEYEYENEDEHE